MRIAISFARAVPRPSNRFATLAQAISRTNPVIAKQCERECRIRGTVFEARAHVVQHGDRPIAVRLGILRREASRDGPQFGLRFGHAHAGLSRPNKTALRLFREVR